MKTKKLYSLLLVMTMVLGIIFPNVGVLAATSSGDGTEESPYLIQTVEELFDISNDTEAHYKLMNDLDLESVIRYDSISSFSGTLDGNGYTIKNLKMSGIYGAGLFSSLDGATIMNLSFENAIVDSMKGAAGVISSYVSNSTIINCSAVGGSVYGLTGSGGLFGKVYSSTLTRCYTNNNANSSSSFAGGLAIIINNSEVTECYVEGDVFGVTFAGGMAAEGSSTIFKNCYVSAKLDALIYGYGDLTGYIASGSNITIENCYLTRNPAITWGYGFGAATISNSYIDMDCIRVTAPTGQVRTTSEMYSQENYVGWDFENVWTIDEGMDYPKLRCFQ